MCFLNFLLPFALLQVNISSHSGHILKHLFNTLCILSVSKPSSQTCCCLVLFFLFILLYCSYYLFARITFPTFTLSLLSVTTFNLSFLASVFWTFQDRGNAAAKFWMYLSHSCTSLASSASTACAPFQPTGNVQPVFHFLPLPQSKGQICFYNSFSQCHSWANLQHTLCSLILFPNSITMK